MSTPIPRQGMPPAAFASATKPALEQSFASTHGLAQMPTLYYQLTSPAERLQHQQWLSQLGNQPAATTGHKTQHLFAHAEPLHHGGWLFSLITHDWSEPGLLDKILEVILRCNQVTGEARIQHARIFTGKNANVINLFEIHGHHGKALQEKTVATILAALRELRYEERKLLQTLRYFPTRNFIPLLKIPPVLDNEVHAEYTCLTVEATRMSHRFISIFLHHIARSTLWWNVQIAEFKQQKSCARLRLYVVDQYQQKIEDSPQVRKALLSACESMNSMLLGFNLYYQRRAWRERDAQCGHTTLQSRPNFKDFLAEIKDLSNLVELHQIENGLRGLVSQGYLTQKDLACIKQAQRFATTHQNTLATLQNTLPTQEHTTLCKRYFALRNRARRIMEPLFKNLSHPQQAHWRFNSKLTLAILNPNQERSRFCCNPQRQLCLQENLWLDNPLQTMELFLLQARTHQPVNPLLLEQVDMIWQGWGEATSQPERNKVGLAFMQVLDTSVACTSGAFVMRTMRDSGVFRYWIPQFKHIEGLIHRSAEHYYTVDEHSLVLIEALQSLTLLRRALPHGAKALLADYHTVSHEAQLLRFWQKHAITLGMLRQDPALRLNPITSSVFRLFDEVAETPLESLMEVGFYERTQETCITAFGHLCKLNQSLGTLFAFEQSLTPSERRVLALAGLLHDLQKPAQNHPELGARALDEVLEATALPLSTTEINLLRWLIKNHLEVRPLMRHVAQSGFKAQAKHFSQNQPSARWAQLLVLFTYADRVAVSFEPNRYQNDMASLSSLLRGMASNPILLKAPH